jgi:hypothetical protein
MRNVLNIATLPPRHIAASLFAQRRVIKCGRSIAAPREGHPLRLVHLRAAAALAAALLPIIALLSPAALAQGTLSGFYKANGKPAVLTQVTAHKGEPESGKPVTVLVFTTKDQANDPKAGFNALFGKYGDAVVVKVFSDGKIYSTDVRHSGLDLGPVPSATLFDVVQMKDFKMAGGEVSGRVIGKAEIRGTPLEIDLTFKAKAP